MATEKNHVCWYAAFCTQGLSSCYKTHSADLPQRKAWTSLLQAGSANWGIYLCVNRSLKRKCQGWAASIGKQKCKLAMLEWRFRLMMICCCAFCELIPVSNLESCRSWETLFNWLRKPSAGFLLIPVQGGVACTGLKGW